MYQKADGQAFTRTWAPTGGLRPTVSPRSSSADADGSAEDTSSQVNAAPTRTLGRIDDIMQARALTEADEKTEDEEEKAMDAILRDTQAYTKRAMAEAAEEESAGELPELSKTTKLTIKMSPYEPFTDYDIGNDHLSGVVDDRKMMAVPAQDISHKPIKALVSDGRSWDLDSLDLD